MLANKTLELRAMTAQSLIAHDIPALSITQSGRDAFHLLSDFHVKHLPVLDGQRLVGIVSEEDIFNHKLHHAIGEYDFSVLRRFSVRADEHIFEVMRVMGENRLTVIPVVDAEGTYLGMVSQNDLLRFFATTASFSEPGGVLVLEMNRRDYSLSTLARIVEDEGAKILSSFVTSGPSLELLEVTLKLDRHELGRVMASLERYEYEVKEVYDENAYTDTLHERYHELMNYLNI
jgi:acetoin utilization protein AcuB